jgi:hypothetical protein
VETAENKVVHTTCEAQSGGTAQVYARRGRWARIFFAKGIIGAASSGAEGSRIPHNRENLFCIKLLIQKQKLVEAGESKPPSALKKSQLADSEIASNAENATISKSAVQSLYKDCLEFPELRPSDFPAWCKSTLKRS